MSLIIIDFDAKRARTGGRVSNVSSKPTIYQDFCLPLCKICAKIIESHYKCPFFSYRRFW